MPSNTEITVSQLARLVGLPTSPVVIDVRTDEDTNADPRFLPGSIRRNALTAADWARDFSGRDVVVVCQKGKKLSQGVTAWLLHEGVRAETFEGGLEAWRAAGGLLVVPDRLPPRDSAGRKIGRAHV